MNEQQFKAAYITNFLSSYMAGRYDEDCQNGHPGQPYNHQPITDAAFLADCAWKQIQENMNDGSLDKYIFKENFKQYL